MTIQQSDQPDANQPIPIGGITLVHNVSLEKFESAVYKRDYEQAGHLLLDTLRKLKAGAEFIGYNPVPPMKKMLYTRFCAAVVSLFADPGFSISQEGFNHIAAEHAIMDMVFRASAFGTSDHLLPHLSDDPTEADKTKMKVTNGPSLAKFLLTYSLRSGFALNFEVVFSQNKEMVFPLWIGMLSALLTVNPQAQEKRELLLGLNGLFEEVVIPDAVLPTLSDAYMYASYGVRRDKHAIKATIHRMFANMMKVRGVKMPTPGEIALRRAFALQGKRAKPVMLVCVEWFSSLHAMYRCYAPVIRQLRTRFHLVAMSRESDIDEIGKAEFDEWYPVKPENLVLAELVGKVEMIAPDIIFHPSLGMALWWNALSSIRLAPIQMMMMGHPASSHSPCMDYALVEEGCVGDPKLFTEMLASYPVGSARFVMRHDAVFPELAAIDPEPAVVNIAIPAMLCKLNAPFLETLQQINKRSKRKVMFHFFINMIGLNLHQSAVEIRDWIPDARIYERNQYPAYIDHLSKCHIHCSTFPFGGTNSNIDSMKCGVPIVTLWGDEPHERYDGMMLRRAGMPEWLIAKTKEEYIEATLRLIENGEERNQLRGHLRATDLDAIFFGDPPEEHKTAIVDLAWEIFTNHEALQAKRHETSEK
jgi:hypothetical protein